LRFTIPPEPVVIKESTNNHHNEKKWDIDSLFLWFGNKLPSYLWREGGWSKPLKNAGYTWQSFLKILSLHKKDMIKWSKNAISWKDLLLKIEETIKDPVFKKLLIAQ
jgi:hypothetical protein